MIVIQDFHCNNSSLLVFARDHLLADNISQTQGELASKQSQQQMAFWSQDKWQRLQEQPFDVSELMRNVQSAFARWHSFLLGNDPFLGFYYRRQLVNLALKRGHILGLVT